MASLANHFTLSDDGSHRYPNGWPLSHVNWRFLPRRCGRENRECQCQRYRSGGRLFLHVDQRSDGFYRLLIIRTRRRRTIAKTAALTIIQAQ
ncbi:hypothetical protein KCP71_25625 [Salmonella enterica subsp. enterica]|nr:hypothetical protein KCP71_25625 [Salmonella enterica subsp. enterica]